jgi:hypothetical protein
VRAVANIRKRIRRSTESNILVLHASFKTQR